MYGTMSTAHWEKNHATCSGVPFIQSYCCINTQKKQQFNGSCNIRWWKFEWIAPDCNIVSNCAYLICDWFGIFQKKKKTNEFWNILQRQEDGRKFLAGNLFCYSYTHFRIVNSNCASQHGNQM